MALMNFWVKREILDLLTIKKITNTCILIAMIVQDNNYCFLERTITGT